VIRSGKAGLAAVALGVAVGAAAFLMLALKLFAVAVALTGVWLLVMVVASLLIRHADSAQLQERSRANQRWMDAWARGMGRASGGWDPRPPTDKT
jgi:ABC-type thiamin/hydroxymethylpyrimidine transport system permease subunit